MNRLHYPLILLTPASVVVILAALAGPAHGQALFEVQARLVRVSDDEHAAYARIEALRTVASRETEPGPDSLTVACRQRELRYWKTTVHVGDTLRFDWERHGRTAKLRIPKEGWPRQCTCAQATNRVEAALHGEFLLAGSRTTEIQVRGSWWLWRILTLGIADGPKAPKTVRVRCAWSINGPGSPTASLER